MLLGEILQSVDRHPEPVELLGDNLNLVTLARAGAAAEQAGLPLGAYLKSAVAGFVSDADEEEWAQLVGMFQDGKCGAGTCLELMLRRKLRKEPSRGDAL